MVISTSENLRTLFEKIKSLGLFGRLFGWNRILAITSAAGVEHTTLNNELVAVYDQNRQIRNQLRSVYQDLEHQKSLLSDLKSEYMGLKNSNVHLLQTHREKEEEITLLRESESKFTKKIAEINRESDQIRSTIEQYKLQVQKKDTEIGALKESEAKNSLKINELEDEVGRAQTEMQEYARKIQDCTREIGALTEDNTQKTKRILELEKDTERYRLTMKQYIQQL
jgi:chromosome segregation ATPase